MRDVSFAAGVALWSWDVDSDAVVMDEAGYALWGVPKQDLTFEELFVHVHPADLARVKSLIQATRDKPGPYEIDFRIQHSDGIRWNAARGLGADESMSGRVVYGIFLDITQRKQVEEDREMLVSEMSHQVKNLFAVASILSAITARSGATTTEIASDLMQRLANLGRSHDLVRRDPDSRDRIVMIGDLFTAFLAPFDESGSIGDRIHVSMPAIAVGEKSATSLALVVQRLAIAAVQHGSLSRVEGTLYVTGVDHGTDVEIVWSSHGCPPSSEASDKDALGNRLVSRMVTGQLGGTFDHALADDGSEIRIRVSKASLAG
jgi:PAS domain S-box-containing protein